MKRITRFIRLILVPMAFFLPFWLTFGRAYLGSGGWGTIVYLVGVAPILFLSLLVLAVLVPVRPDTEGRGHVGEVDAMLLGALYLSILLQGFFIVDGGDTPESLGSVATNIFGPAFQDASASLSSLFATSATALIIVCGIVFIYERTKRQLR